MLGSNFECEGTKSTAVFNDVVSYFKNMSKGELLWITEVVNVLKLILVMPATNATSERSFSSMRRLKTYLRSTMTQARLNDIMILNVHRTKTDKLNLLDIARCFAFKDNRMNIFGKF